MAQAGNIPVDFVLGDIIVASLLEALLIAKLVLFACGIVCPSGLTLFASFIAAAVNTLMLMS